MLKGVTAVRIASAPKGRKREMDIHACIHTYTQTHTCIIAPDNSPEVVKTSRLSDTDDNPFDHPVHFMKDVDNNDN